MAYVGEVPWHGLGTDLGDELVDSEFMYNNALNWQVKLAKTKYTADLVGMEAEDFRVVYRDDTGAALGVVGKDWEPIQNKTMFDFMDSVLESAEADPRSYTTAGSLFGGKQVFAAADISEFHVNRRGGDRDLHQTYLVNTMGHTGKAAYVSAFTTIRPVCNNTLQWGLANAQDLIKIKHTRHYEDKLEAAKEIYAAQMQYSLALCRDLQYLEETPIVLGQVERWAANVFNPLPGEVAMRSLNDIMADIPKKEKGERLDRREIFHDDVTSTMKLFKQGKGNRGETKYDAIQGLTEYLDHHRERYTRAKDLNNWQQKRMVGTIFGDNRTFKTKAVNLLRRW
jgi:phage/plasmid-like protein (TIGR03299 family)